MEDFSKNVNFGVELEINSFDKRDFKRNPLKSGELPEGIHYISDKVSKILNNFVEITQWHLTHNNDNWLLKPDSSCGMELCSPVFKGVSSISIIHDLISELKNYPEIESNDDCSLHLHVNVSNLLLIQIAKIFAYWIKAEPLYIDSLPKSRKNNEYCQFIGLTDKIDCSKSYINYFDLIYLFGDNKYYSINSYHYLKKNRPTIEFRLLGNEGCQDPIIAKNWIRFILYFVEMAIQLPYPTIKWYDLDDFMVDFKLDDNVEEYRNWFLTRIYNNVSNNVLRSKVKTDVVKYVEGIK